MSDVIKFGKDGKTASPIGEYLIRNELKRRDYICEPWMHDADVRHKLRQFAEKLIKNESYDSGFVYEQMYLLADTCFSIYSQRHAKFKEEIDEQLRSFYPELSKNSELEERMKKYGDLFTEEPLSDSRKTYHAFCRFAEQLIDDIGYDPKTVYENMFRASHIHCLMHSDKYGELLDNYDEETLDLFHDFYDEPEAEKSPG